MLASCLRFLMTTCALLSTQARYSGRLFGFALTTSLPENALPPAGVGNVPMFSSLGHSCRACRACVIKASGANTYMLSAKSRSVVREASGKLGSSRMTSLNKSFTPTDPFALETNSLNSQTVCVASTAAGPQQMEPPMLVTVTVFASGAEDGTNGAGPCLAFSAGSVACFTHSSPVFSCASMSGKDVLSRCSKKRANSASVSPSDLDLSNF
mmetsp:Transcript_10386/g.18985  ORF Transcript_10386/g.18985 Transcript_10386/m.18985 type:complete len:211 (+) Transcript_10386:641-1273(+)